MGKRFFDRLDAAAFCKSVATTNWDYCLERAQRADERFRSKRDPNQGGTRSNKAAQGWKFFANGGAGAAWKALVTPFHGTEVGKEDELRARIGSSQTGS
jgi:hypothetical protein